MTFTLAGIRGTTRDLFGSTAVYHRAKASWIYDLYWTGIDRRIVNDRHHEVLFYRQLLGGFRRGGLIFDVGANEGYKTDIFLRLGARVVAIEPDDHCQEILRSKFLKYRLKRKPVSIVGIAVSDRRSVKTMWIEAPGSGMNTLNGKWTETLRSGTQRFGRRFDFGRSKDVETVALEELIEAYGPPFYVKIDVEGHELDVLRGLKRPVPYLSFEVNLPEFRPEGPACIEVLRRLAPEGEFNYTSDCRRGLALPRWLGGAEFSVLLGTCTQESIEVFFKVGDFSDGTVPAPTNARL